jgi:hypothetical protein
MFKEGDWVSVKFLSRLRLGQVVGRCKDRENVLMVRFGNQTMRLDVSVCQHATEHDFMEALTDV